MLKRFTFPFVLGVVVGCIPVKAMVGADAETGEEEGSGSGDAGGSDSGECACEALEARLASVETNLEALQNYVYSSSGTGGVSQDDLEALESAVSSSLDQVAEDVEDLAAKQGRAWTFSATDVTITAGVYTWNTVASGTLDLEHTGPVLAWCQIGVGSGDSGRATVQLALTDASGSSTAGPAFGDAYGSVGGFDGYATAIGYFTPTTAGDATINCAAYGAAEWAEVTISVIQLAEAG